MATKKAPKSSTTPELTLVPTPELNSELTLDLSQVSPEPQATPVISAPAPRSTRKAPPAGYDQATWNLMSSGLKAAARKRAQDFDGVNGLVRAAQRASATLRARRPVISA